MVDEQTLIEVNSENNRLLFIMTRRFDKLIECTLDTFGYGREIGLHLTPFGQKLDIILISN